MRKPIILPIDGKQSLANFKTTAESILAEKSAYDLIGFLKINDAAHISDGSGPKLVEYIKTSLKDMFGYVVGVFLDLKLADTNGTIKNTLKHYQSCPPDIVTLRDSCSAKGFLDARRVLPTTKIALVSALTDMPEKECQRRYGMIPAIKIVNDANNIIEEYQAVRDDSDPEYPFDMIVCSPLEISILRKFFGSIVQLIVPGIRDAWMNVGQQARVDGVASTLNKGADYVVMGSQMTKGNPDNNISPEESRQLTAQEVAKADLSNIVPESPLQTLINYDGFYECPTEGDKKYLGPLVGYAGKDEEGKNFVGPCYFNISMVESSARTRRYFAELIAIEIFKNNVEPEVILGAPMGGILFAGAVGDVLNCKTVFAEKKVIAPAEPEQGLKERSELVIKRHELSPGQKVIILEDLCNNFSTTSDIIKLVEGFGAEVVGIACVLNRSNKTVYRDLPVMAVIHKPSPQFRQSDPEVKELVEAGNVIWKPKHDWPKLKSIMDSK